MKKLATALCLAAVELIGCAQGTVTFANYSFTLVRTNATAISYYGTAGPTAPSTSGSRFYYALLTAPSTVTSLDANAQDLTADTFGQIEFPALVTLLCGSEGLKSQSSTARLLVPTRAMR